MFSHSTIPLFVDISTVNCQPQQLILFCIFSDQKKFGLANMEQRTRITVAFLSSRSLDSEEMEEDEEEEEDDDDDDFDFSTAGIKSKLPGKRIVEMKVSVELNQQNFICKN